jgi:hypothetical protein
LQQEIRIGGADYKNFHNWVTRHSRVIKGGSAPLQECYLACEGFAKEELWGIPISRKAVGQLLRDQLLSKRRAGTVRTTTQRRVTIAGIELQPFVNSKGDDCCG